jgi:hypothetical protein
MKKLVFLSFLLLSLPASASYYFSSSPQPAIGAAIGVSYNVTAQTLTNQNTYYTWSTGWLINSQDNMTASTSGTLTCVVPGVYEIVLTITYSKSSAPDDIHGGISLNNAEPQGNREWTFKTNSSDETDHSVCARIRMKVGDYVSVKIVDITSGGKTVTVTHSNFMANFVGY